MRAWALQWWLRRGQRADNEAAVAERARIREEERAEERYRWRRELLINACSRALDALETFEKAAAQWAAAQQVQILPPLPGS
jgi:hypothetical protein